MSKEISLRSFYGRKDLSNLRELRRKRRMEEAEAKVRSDTLLTTQFGLTLSSYPYHVFATQKLAIEKAAAENLTCFAFELDERGKRGFCVTHPIKMWHMISSRKRHKRHFYEVIPQGWRCKLYFDIEYSKALNASRDGDLGLEAFVKFVQEKLAENFNMTLKPNQVMDLESSSEIKFSRHLIFDVCFVDNFAAGNFVKKILEEIPPNVKDLVTFKKADDSCQTFVDVGVYSKNRNFRLFSCSKFNKKVALQLSDHCKSIFASLRPRDIFLRSLITYLPDEEKILDFGPEKKNNFYSHAPKTEPLAEGKNQRLQQTSSPFPEVDEFISSKISPGYIRKVIWKEQEATIEYEISGFRFCANVNRWHKSNNIKLVALLNRGIYFQLCHDPDCQGFKSEDFFLPVDCQPWIYLFQDDQDHGDGDDDTLDPFADGEDDFFLEFINQHETSELS